MIRVLSTSSSGMILDPKPVSCWIQIFSNNMERVEFDKEGTWNWNINMKETKQDVEVRMEFKESSSPSSPSSHHSPLASLSSSQ